MILKMDVEGAEWGFLTGVDQAVLERFEQMTFEFHSLNDPADAERMLAVFEKLNQTHRLVHLHTNNYSDISVSIGGKNFPALLEATYASRRKYHFVEGDDVVLPLDVDHLNRPDLPDIRLGRWNRSVDMNKEGDTLCVEVRFL